MSRGGRGGGRGGRGGGRGGRPNVPWDTGDEPDGRPSELFPPYIVPSPRTLSTTESSSIHHFLLLRRQMHSSSLFTSRRSAAHDPTNPRKVYTQAQTNALYAVKNKASVDPFTAVPTYSQRFVREERALPDWTSRPICRELFPDELLDLVDPAAAASGGSSSRKRRKLEVSRVSSLPNAEEAFGIARGDEYDYIDEGAEGEAGDHEASRRRLLERLDSVRDDEEGAAGGAEGVDDEEGLEEEEQDEAYDDEDAGDYDAENYFDNGDEGFEDYGDGEDGEGTF